VIFAKVTLSNRYDIKCDEKEMHEDDFQTPSLLPAGSPSLGSIIILDSSSQENDTLFSH
jgi:hypothetical protein